MVAKTLQEAIEELKRAQASDKGIDAQWQDGFKKGEIIADVKNFLIEHRAVINDYILELRHDGSHGARKDLKKLDAAKRLTAMLEALDDDPAAFLRTKREEFKEAIEAAYTRDSGAYSKSHDDQRMRDAVKDFEALMQKHFCQGYALEP